MATLTIPAQPARRHALLAALIRKAGAATSAGPIPRRPSRVRTAALSSGQQRLWLLDRLAPGSAMYNVPLCFRLRGPLDQNLFARTLREIARRHEILRTTFEMEGAEPVQRIRPDLDIAPRVVHAESLLEARSLALDEARRPFDLARGPLLRCTLYKIGESDHLVLLTMHHIVCDGWSLGVLLRELATIYEAFSNGRPHQLAEPPLQYADFALWQRERLTTGKLGPQLAYWRDRLNGVPPILELPADRPRPAQATFRGALTRRSLRPGLMTSLRRLAAAESATTFMTLLAAFAALLHRYTGQPDIVIGSAIANRNRSELEPLIGFFPNTLPLRSDLSGDPSFLEALRRVRESVLGAQANQEAPFEKIVGELPNRGGAHSPLFQVAFLMQDTPAPGARFGSFEITPVDLDLGTAKCDLTLTISAQSACFEYSTDLFDSGTIDRMMDHFEVLLEGIAADPARRILELPLLTPAEERSILIDWNCTQAPFPQDCCAHELFEQQVKRTPQGTALLFQDDTISYAQLNESANRVARVLRHRGVRPDTLVGIALDRSPHMITAILGVLKAGGAYLPLALDHPKERIEFVLEDARPLLLISTTSARAKLPDAAAKLDWLDIEVAAVAGESSENLQCASGPNNLAYVIYTSGSTGRPKGVMLEHSGLSNLAAAQQKLFQLGPGDRVLQFAAPTFDASVWEIFMALASGAALCLGDGSPFLPDELARVLRGHRVTTATLPPSVLTVLSPSEFPDLHTVISAGESCTDEIVRRWRAGRSFYNAYGPTETTVCATAKKCDSSAERITIGRPIANTTLYVLDRQMRPQPIGIPGELHIGGAGLARGYLNRPELTASRFVPDPFGTEPNSRLYKTGDLVRYLPDGELEFLGRIDDQVKIRGFRIELGEIESRLSQHAAVLHCAVIAREDTPGNRQLVAYIAPRADAPDPAELRRFLSAALPEYMVPSAFVILASMPLTSSGKIDRRALPAPRAERSKTAAFRDALELQLARIWEEVLGVATVGPENNFFELGGNSLLAVTLLARIRELTGRDLPLATLFRSGSVEQIAAALRAGARGSAPHSIVPIRTGGSRPPLFLVHPAGGNVLCYFDLALALGEDQPVYGIEAAPDMKGLSIETMAAKYVDQLLAAPFSGPYRLGGWSSGGLVAFAMAQELRRRGREVELLVLLDTWAAVNSPDPTDAELVAIAQQARTGAQTPEHELRKVAHRFRAGIRAARAYVPKNYPGRVVLIRASESGGPDDRGWKAHCTGRLEIRSVPANHSELLSPPHAAGIASQLDPALSGRDQRVASLARVAGIGGTTAFQA